MADAIEAVNGFYGGLAGGDLPGAFAKLAPDVTWTEAEGFAYGGTYIGPDAVLTNVFARLGSEWSEFRGVPDTVISDGDQVVARGWYTGTYNQTGRELRARFVHWFTVHDDLITEFEQIVDSALVDRCIADR